MITEILNSFINVRNKILDKDEWVDLKKKNYTHRINERYSMAIESGKEYTLATTIGKPVILQSLEISSSVENGFAPRLYNNNKDYESAYNGNLFHIINKSGGRGNATVNYINLHGSSFLESFAGTNGGKIMLKEPIFLPEGMILSVYGMSDSNITYKYSYYEIEGGI